MNGGLFFPWAPRILWPNGGKGKHWGGVSRARNKQRSDALIVCRAAKLTAAPPDGPIRLLLTFVPTPRTRTFDLDNALASQKSALDALAEALGCDDRRFILQVQRGERLGPYGRGGMLVTFLDDTWQPVGAVASSIVNRVAEGRA